MYIELVENGRKNMESSSVDQRITLSGILKIECESEDWIGWSQYRVKC
jgi:hypothetical protein